MAYDYIHATKGDFMKIADIARIIEAVVFVSGDGVDRDEFKRLYDLSDKELNKCLDILKAKYNEESGINIITYKNKIQFCSNPTLVDKVAEILNPIRERSLTKSALETIAIIAYKQPITRSEIEQIRGTSSDYAMQLLQSNNLIEVVGRKDTVGKPLLFGTTETFLKRFELESLDNLPNHKELLDRIRVIHSDGESLYREFTIPDEDKDDTSKDLDETAEDATEQANESVDTDISVAETQDENTAEVPVVEQKPKRKKVSKNTNEKIDEVVEQAQTQQTNETIAPSAEDNKPKLSWRDKMKAKMAENADNYDNLDEVLERKQ